MTKSTPTLTQSGLLAVLLQRQRYRVFQLARRSAHHKRAQAAFWNTLTWARHQRWSTGRRTLESFTRPIAMSHQTHTDTELRQQIHDDLRIKYPEWVEPNGESSMCLMEVLDTLTRRGFTARFKIDDSATEAGDNEPRSSRAKEASRHRAAA